MEVTAVAPARDVDATTPATIAARENETTHKRANARGLRITGEM